MATWTDPVIAISTHPIVHVPINTYEDNNGRITWTDNDTASNAISVDTEHPVMHVSINTYEDNNGRITWTDNDASGGVVQVSWAGAADTPTGSTRLPQYWA